MWHLFHVGGIIRCGLCLKYKYIFYVEKIFPVQLCAQYLRRGNILLGQWTKCTMLCSSSNSFLQKHAKIIWCLISPLHVLYKTISWRRHILQSCKPITGSIFVLTTQLFHSLNLQHKSTRINECQVFGVNHTQNMTAMQ